MIDLVELDERHRSVFETLLSESWQQNWSAEVASQIIQWRYYERPSTAVTWLALERDQKNDNPARCVAILDSMVRPYLYNHQRVWVRETADWYCTPSRRPYGVGLWLLRQLARYPEPVFVLGGSALTLDLLPKLKWTILPPAGSYILPLTARGLAANMLRQRWWQYEKIGRVVPRLRIRSPRRVAPPSGRRPDVRMLSKTDEVVLDPPNQDGLVQLLETAHWQWLARMPPCLAQPIGLLFTLDDAPAGVTYSQIEPAATSLDARIVHLQVTDPAISGWIISETTSILADHGVEFVRCCVSTSSKITAVEEVGYIRSKDVPCHWWPNQRGTPEQLDVGYLRGDDAMPFHALRGRNHVR
jgi:hypothetical protein